MNYPGDYTAAELMAIVLARDIPDDSVGEMGAYSEVPMAACKLARLMHAPSFQWICSAAGMVTPKGPLYHSSTDFRNSQGCEGSYNMNDVNIFIMRKVDFFFAGGIQVDRFGNINLTVIGDYYKPKLRGPGAAALPMISSLPIKYYIYQARHDRLTFVEKVDFISAPGYIDGPEGRARVGLPSQGGPKLVVTPLGVLDFPPETCHMRLKAVHPGVSPEQVQENTGFPLDRAPQIEETPPPTTEELHLLHSKVDPHGILREMG